MVTATVAVIPPCDYCGIPARYDGKTDEGPWAYMCGLHFMFHGVGLGTGRGQRLLLPTTEQDQ